MTTFILAFLLMTALEFIAFGWWFIGLGPRTNRLSRPMAYVIGTSTIVVTFTAWLYLTPGMPGKGIIVFALTWFCLVGGIWPVLGRIYLKWVDMQNWIEVHKLRDE